VDNILNPTYLDNELGHFGAVQEILRTTAPWASAWVGEAGGAYNSGHHLVTDAFVFSFWLVHATFLIQEFLILKRVG
jgi:heparanase 1